MSDLPLLPYASPRFYRLSGRTTPAAVTVGLTLAVVAGAVIGSLTGAAELGGHMIPSGKLMAIVEIGSVLGAGAAIGWLVTRLLVELKSRSRALAYGCVLLSCLVALYFAWASWCYTLILYMHGSTPYYMFLAPERLFRAIRLFNESGVWYFVDSMPKGPILAGFWIGEAVTLVACAAAAAKKQLARKVFCEQCQAWGAKRHLMQIQDTHYAQMQTDLLAGRTEVFDNAEKFTWGSTWCNVTLEGCPTCDTLQALTLERTVVTPGKKRKPTTKTTKLVHRLLLTPDQTAQVAIAAAMLDKSAPAATDLSPTSPTGEP